MLGTEQSLQPLEWAAAAANGKEICIRKLLDAGASFEDSGFWSTQREDPMTIAAKNGHIDIVRMFLDHGIDPIPAIDEEIKSFPTFNIDELIIAGSPLSVAVLGSYLNCQPLN